MKHILSILILSLVVITNSAIAETDFVCAAVYPCDEEGNLDKAYTNPDSPCFDYYLGQCLIARLQITKNSLQACEFEKADLESTVESLSDSQRKLIKLRKKLRELRAN